MFPQHSSHWCTTRQFHYLTLKVWACQLWANTLCSCSRQWMLKVPTKWQDWLVWALLHIKKIHCKPWCASQCREGNLHPGLDEAVLCTWRLAGTFALSLPTARGKCKGCQLAPGDLAHAKHQLKLEHFLLLALLWVPPFEYSNNT